MSVFALICVPPVYSTNSIFLAPAIISSKLGPSSSVESVSFVIPVSTSVSSLRTEFNDADVFAFKILLI